jgi:photosystem II stability/assembly factor-like uncharacterized protein
LWLALSLDIYPFALTMRFFVLAACSTLSLLCGAGCVIKIGGETPTCNAGSCGGSGAGGDTLADPGSDGSRPTTDVGRRTTPADASVQPADAAEPRALSSNWENVTNNLLTLASGGGDVIVAAQPNSARVIVGVGKNKGLFASDDDGASWFGLGAGAGSAKITNGPTAVVFDPVQDETWWEVGIYGEGVFRTTDNGETFSHLGDSNHCDFLSIDFTDPKRATLLAGPHEVSRVLHLSRDSGKTWSNVGGSLPEDSSSATYPLVLDADTFLVASCGGPGRCGIFRTQNGGTSWTRVSDEGPTGAPLVTSNGSIYWSLTPQGMVVSDDQGTSWRRTADGPVMLRYGSGPAELPDGRIVTLANRALIATSDGGQSWKRVSPDLPYPGENCGIYGLTYSTASRKFYINHNDCSGTIGAESIFSSALD